MASSERPRVRSMRDSDGSELKAPRVVIADDDRLARELLAGILRNAGYTVDTCEDGQEAVERVAQGGVDLVLLDSVMPRLGGLEACRILKSMTLEGFLPVVLVTVRTDTASRVEGLRIGADDYVCKPYDEGELLARVAGMIRIKRIHDQATSQKARFERLSVHDEMTGLYNHRYLHVRLNEEFKRAERYHEPFACVLVDIDQLRAVNDTAGRGAGDAVVRRVADGIKQCVREVDVLARFGGDEYILVLPSTHFAGSVVVAERIWREVSGRSIDDTGDRKSEPGTFPARSREETPTMPPPSDPKWAQGPRDVTVSIGVALYPSRDVRTKEALIRAAEAALAQAKREGGNRICVFQQQGYIYTPAIGGAADRGGARQSSDPVSSRSSALVAASFGPPGRGRMAAAASDSWRPAAAPPAEDPAFAEGAPKSRPGSQLGRRGG